MTTIAAVAKDGLACIAADSLTSLGEMRLPPEIAEAAVTAACAFDRGSAPPVEHYVVRLRRGAPAPVTGVRRRRTGPRGSS